MSRVRRIGWLLVNAVGACGLAAGYLACLVLTSSMRCAKDIVQ